MVYSIPGCLFTVHHYTGSITGSNLQYDFQLVSLYDKVWFGTVVWDKDGYDILRAYMIWSSVRSVIKS